MDQHEVPEAVAQFTNYEFVDWATPEATQRALTEMDRTMASAEVLFKQMVYKRREIGRSMDDLSRGIAFTAGKYTAMAQELQKMAAS